MLLVIFLIVTIVFISLVIVYMTLKYKIIAVVTINSCTFSRKNHKVMYRLVHKHACKTKI